ncbi:MAG TPA: hypothetical protein VMU94_17955 [Streptosporangiaceae bacterium]|nr:hypothetical protein [Streptosporangiaceae bacterium]
MDFARAAWDEIRPDAQRRQGAMLGAAAEAGGQDLAGLAGMIGRSEHTRLLTGIAMTGAAGTAWPPKVSALGRALADGLITDDDQINIADLVLPAMADMDRPHVSLLELLVQWMPESSAGHLRIIPYSHDRTPDAGSPNRAWGEYEISKARPALDSVVTSLIGTLLRHGLIVQDDNLDRVLASYADKLAYFLGDFEATPARPTLPRLPEYAVRSILESPSWSPTALGEQVLDYYRIAGEFTEGHTLTPGPD